MKPQYFWLGVLVVVAWCWIWAPRVAVAQTIVIGPSSTLYKIGDQLSNDPMLDIFFCFTLTLRIGDKFQEFAGPYKGPLSKYKKPKVFCMTTGERAHVYDDFFRQVCDKLSVCDATCTAVFAKLQDKQNMRLKCP